jgi:phospholipase/carboxylesterase
VPCQPRQAHSYLAHRVKREAYTRPLSHRILAIAIGFGAIACREAREPARAEAAPLTYEERVVGTATASAKLPMIVAVHGLGDRPDSFAALMQGFDLPVRVILPRAPTPHDPGFSWFSVRLRDGKVDVLSDEVVKQADRVSELIRDLVQRRPTDGKPILLGFSQGGMITFAIALRHPDQIRAAIPIGGWLAPELMPDASEARKLPPIYALHGALDRAVPFEEARATVRTLAEKGARAELIADPRAGHEISVVLRARLFGLLRAQLRPLQ